MASIINSIAFKNFYNFYGDYSDNRYDFKEGLNIINAEMEWENPKCSMDFFGFSKTWCMIRIHEEKKLL